ncbi:MAG: SagB family peptide dehydrogenase [Bacteroidota bacterium]
MLTINDNAVQLMTDVFKLSFRPGIQIKDQTTTALALRNGQYERRIENLSPEVIQALSLVAEGRFSKEELSEQVFRKGGLGALSLFHYNLIVLDQACLIDYILYIDNEPYCRYENMIGETTFTDEQLHRQRFQLSSFAFLRRQQQHFVLESANSTVKLTFLSSKALDLLAGLSNFGDLTRFTQQSSLDQKEALAFLSALATGGFLEFEYDQSSQELSELWNFHDLLFHSRSRYGRHNKVSGGNYRFIGRRPPKAPKRAMPHALKHIPLAVPRPETLRHSQSLAECMDKRKSDRVFGGMDLQTLGHFLYRCLHVKGSRPYLVEARGQQQEIEILSAPYPSGGGMYEIDFYLTINDCEGLAPGFYYYNGFEHQLSLLAEKNEQTELMLMYARICAGITDSPPLLITFAADFARMFWKYESMAYAAILKNVGVIYQTLYLVATDMGLGSCAIGNGNVEVFKKLTNFPLLQESSLGEFILGTPIKE